MFVIIVRLKLNGVIIDDYAFFPQGVVSDQWVVSRKVPMKEYLLTGEKHSLLTTDCDLSLTKRTDCEYNDAGEVCGKFDHFSKFMVLSTTGRLFHPSNTIESLPDTLSYMNFASAGHLFSKS